MPKEIVAQHIDVIHIKHGKEISTSRYSTPQLIPKGDYIHLTIGNGNAGVKLYKC